MDEAAATSNGSTVKRSEDPEEAKTGWLTKKTHFTRRWRPAWFQIKESKLLYGGNEQMASKTISLSGAQVEVIEGSGGFGWSITPKNSRRTFFLRASSAEEQQEWMEAICEAQMKCEEHSSNACVVQ